uniref:CCHamide 1 transcript a n=1 Tax=Carabus violaceus TaxID=41075 RepID=A0A7U3RBQ0_CARVO|nr:CCHamide 1 transcript a [Carabus violaceus]
MSPTSANVLLFKTAIVLLVFCFAECAAGSCLKYGHSCWGAHGKRNGAPINGNGPMLRVREDGPMVNTRWYLSRLVQAPADLRLWRDDQDRHSMVARKADKHIQNDSEVDTEYTKRADETEDLTADSAMEDADAAEEVLVMEEPSSSALGQKLRLYKLMKKNADKLN